MTTTDFHPPFTTPIPAPMTTEFEGALVTDMDARLPAIKVECPEAYKRGTILKLTMEVRVKSVRLEENRDGDLTRSHIFAVESVNVDEVYDPAEMIAQLSGSVDVDPGDVVAPLPVDLAVAEPTTEERIEVIAEALAEAVDDLQF